MQDNALRAVRCCLHVAAEQLFPVSWDRAEARNAEVAGIWEPSVLQVTPDLGQERWDGGGGGGQEIGGRARCED